MLKEIRIVDKKGFDITKDKSKLVAIPDGKGNLNFITKDEAENILKNLDTALTEEMKSIIKGQLLLMEVENIVGKGSQGKDSTDINRKTGGAT